jgi:hypothetical protein
LVMVLVSFSSSLFSPFCFLFGSLVSSFGFSPLHFLCNKQKLGAREVLFYWSRYLIFCFVPSCHVLVSLPFICYLTNKHLVQRRFHFTSQGTCFLNFIPSGHVLVYLPFISYLTTRTWGIGGSILRVMVLVFFSSSLFSPF